MFLRVNDEGRRKIFASVYESSIAGSGHDGVAQSGTINPGDMAESRKEDDEILTNRRTGLQAPKTTPENDLQACPE